MKLYRISFPRSATLLVDCEDEYEAVQYALTQLVVKEEEWEKRNSGGWV